MELELRLGLPVSAHFPGRSFDLNISNALLIQEEQPNERVVKNGGLDVEFKNLTVRQQKRRFNEAFGKDDDNKTLSLLVWNGRQPNDEEDGEEHNRMHFNPAGKNNEEDDQIVGWPPIKSWRKKLLHGGPQHRVAEPVRANVNGVRNPIFVKVKMVGVVIGRKIDLTRFDSYQALTNTLLNMFAKYRDGDKDDEPYILSYLDKEGDWLIAGDVPWQIFIESVQRMEILKQSS